MTIRFVPCFLLWLALGTAGPLSMACADEVPAITPEVSPLRELTPLQDYNGYVLAGLYNDTQLKSACELMDKYRQDKKPLDQSLGKAKAAFQKGVQTAGTTLEEKKTLFLAMGKAEGALDVLDYKLRSALIQLFSEAEKQNFEKVKKHVFNFRQLVSLADKTLLSCAGDLSAERGYFAALYTDAQYDTAMDSLKKLHKEHFDAAQLKYAASRYKFNRVYANMASTAEQLETAYFKYREAEFEMKLITRKRDFDLWNILSAEQKKAVSSNLKKIKTFMAKLNGQKGGARLGGACRGGETTERALMWLMGYNGGMIVTTFDDSQWINGRKLIVKARNENKSVQKKIKEAKSAYDKAFYQAATTKEQLKPLFDVMAKAEFAAECLDRKIEVDLKGLLTEAQLAHIKELKKRTKDFRTEMCRHDDTHEGCCGAVEAKVGIEVNVYKDNQYETAMALVKESNAGLAPLMTNASAKSGEYKKTLALVDATPEKLEAACLEAKTAKFEHGMAALARDGKLYNLLSLDQKKQLNKLHKRFAEYVNLLWS